MSDFERFRNVMIITSAGRPKTGNFHSLRQSSRLRNVYGRNSSVSLLTEGEKVRPATTGSRFQSSSK